MIHDHPSTASVVARIAELEQQLDSMIRRLDAEIERCDRAERQLRAIRQILAEWKP